MQFQRVIIRRQSPYSITSGGFIRIPQLFWDSYYHPCMWGRGRGIIRHIYKIQMQLPPSEEEAIFRTNAEKMVNNF